MHRALSFYVLDSLRRSVGMGFSLLCKERNSGNPLPTLHHALAPPLAYIVKLPYHLCHRGAAYRTVNVYRKFS